MKKLSHPVLTIPSVAPSDYHGDSRDPSKRRATQALVPNEINTLDEKSREYELVEPKRSSIGKVFTQKLSSPYTDPAATLERESATGEQ